MEIFKDFEGNILEIGDGVLFSMSVWDGAHNYLKRGTIIGFEFGEIQVEYMQTSFTFNNETKRHDIPNIKTSTCFVKEHSVLKLQ